MPKPCSTSLLSDECQVPRTDFSGCWVCCDCGEHKAFPGVLMWIGHKSSGSRDCAWKQRPLVRYRELSLCVFPWSADTHLPGETGALQSCNTKGSSHWIDFPPPSTVVENCSHGQLLQQGSSSPHTLMSLWVYLPQSNLSCWYLAGWHKACHLITPYICEEAFKCHDGSAVLFAWCSRKSPRRVFWSPFASLKLGKDFKGLLNFCKL